MFEWLYLQIFAAASCGFKCTGFEINSILVAYARSKAHWKGLSTSRVTFVNKDFWKVVIHFNNILFFLHTQKAGVTKTQY